MKRLLLGAVASLTLAAVAFAGASAQRSTTTNWGGLYIGANGTFQSNNTTYTFTSGGGGVVQNGANTTFSQHGNGNGFGGQVGFNVQRGRFMFGVDGVFNQNNLVVDSINNLGTNSTGFNIDYQTALKSTSSAALRLGYANNSTLYYVKGGAAVGRFTSNISTQTAAATFNGFNQTHVTGGWVYGAGAEWAFNPNNTNVLAGLEYDYYRFNNVVFGGALNTSNGTPVQYTLGNPNLSTVQVRLSYKFHQ